MLKVLHMATDEGSTLDADLRIRISRQDLKKFKKKSSDVGKHPRVLVREMISAFNDNRLRIIQTKEEKELYQ